MQAGALCLAAVLLAGCTGVIGAGSSDEEQPSTGPRPASASFSAAPGGVRRLTVPQYRNSVRDLLGDVAIPSEIPAVESGPYGFATVNAATVEISGLAVEKFDAAARAIAKSVIADSAKRTALVGCEPSDACIDTFLRRFGRRVFRRPVTGEEIAAYTALINEVGGDYGNTWSGVEHALAAMLEAPSFLYIRELGEGDGNHRAHDDYELAARLSFFLWNTTPDDALLDAAERGELSTAEGVTAAARRLLASPRAREAVRAFFGEQLNIDGLEQVSKSAAIYPSWSPDLARSMRTEIERVIESLVFDRKADFRTLLDTRETFVDGNLAKLYGLPAPPGEGFAPAKLPADSPRAGLLGFAGIMAASARETETSPTRRGLFIRQRLLCLELPPPPDALADLIAEEQMKAASGEHRTMRERLERQRTDSACSHCHALMDPPGLALEHFDGIGAYRRDDNGLPIDASGDLDGRKFVGAVGLGDALRDDPRFSSCLTRQVYRFASGHVDGPGESDTLKSLSTDFASGGYRFDQLLVAIAASDGFRFASSPR